MVDKILYALLVGGFILLLDTDANDIETTSYNSFSHHSKFMTASSSAAISVASEGIAK